MLCKTAPPGCEIPNSNPQTEGSLSSCTFLLKLIFPPVSYNMDPFTPAQKVYSCFFQYVHSPPPCLYSKYSFFVKPSPFLTLISSQVSPPYKTLPKCCGPSTTFLSWSTLVLTQQCIRIYFKNWEHDITSTTKHYFKNWLVLVSYILGPKLSVHLSVIRAKEFQEMNTQACVCPEGVHRRVQSTEKSLTEKFNLNF